VLAALVVVAVALASVAFAAAPASAAERVRYETERAVVEMEPGALGPAEAEAFARLVDRGIADIETLVGPGVQEPQRRRGRLRYVVSARARMSRTWGRTVVLPLERVRTRSAPYLHETAHALLPAGRGLTWLSEGLACYLESWVAENRGGYDAHVFTRAGDRDIHAAARRYLEGERGRAVMPWVGRPGEPPDLDRDRTRVARPFYVLSHSLAKYLVDGAGLPLVVGLLDAADADLRLAQETRRSADAWRRAWLASLGAE